MIILGSDTFFGYFKFIKYFYPYYDLTIKILFNANNPAMKQALQLTGIDIPTDSTIEINIFLYFCLLILIEIHAY